MPLDYRWIRLSDTLKHVVALTNEPVLQRVHAFRRAEEAEQFEGAMIFSRFALGT
jgi:hypothetical protein